MGKCCVHFESPDDLPLEAIGKLISAISSETWIEMYEQSRSMTKAGQAKMAKQRPDRQGARQARRQSVGLETSAASLADTWPPRFPKALRTVGVSSP